MKKIAYFELSSGISGDMLLGSLVDLGGDVKVLNDVIEELELNNVHIEVTSEERGLSGKNLNIKYKDQPHRSVVEIIDKIEDSDLGEKVKKKSVEAFRLIGEVESKIHDVPFEELELHEVGMIDSIIDVVGSASLIEDLNIDEIYASTVHLGSGYTECEHGKIPVPVPATEKLLEDWNVKFTDKKGELVTPTGAAMLNVLAEQSHPPDMRLEKIGVGFGDREMETPNALRIFLGLQKNLDENVDVLTFYVDDMSPELLGYALEKIREKALDVYTLTATGKKGREGWEVKVLSKKSQTEEVIETIFKETSTLGLRLEEVRRIVLDRSVEKVLTEWGKVKVKISSKGVSPEYESCKEIAEREDISIMKVYDAAKENYEKEK